MDRVFGRRSSQEAYGSEDDSEASGVSQLRSSITEGSSRIFDSVLAKKNGLFDGISSKFDQVLKIGDSLDESSPSQSPTVKSPPYNTTSSDSKPAAKRPPPPRPARPNVNGRQFSVDSYTDSPPRTPPPRPQKSASVCYDQYNPDKRWSVDKSPDVNWSNTGNRAPEYNRRASSGVPGNPFREAVGNPFTTEAEPKVKSPPPSDFGGPFSGDRQADDMDLMGGSNLIPGISQAANSDFGGGLMAPQQRDLLAITPTMSETLPMPVEPSQVTSRHKLERSHTDGSGDGNSSATEGCDDVANTNDFADYDHDGSMFRSGSVGSENSWSSADSQMDETNRECMEFMKGFVGKIFLDSTSITQADKAKFGELCQHGPGRLWFARYVNAQRVNQKCVEEHVFYQLVQYFAIHLFECNEMEDYGPAKTLMNMCFTFYYEARQPKGPDYKHFLYSYLKNQAIWQSLRFWNAAFFDAVQHERARRPVCSSVEGKEVRQDDREYQENITFGQLGTFTCNMRAFGLNKDLCSEFLRKQSTIANLKDEQIGMLRENVEKWKD